VRIIREQVKVVYDRSDAMPGAIQKKFQAGLTIVYYDTAEKD
jgi:hypothetical protein